MGFSQQDVGGCNCACSITIWVKACDTGTDASGATVTVAGVGSCTTPANGKCTFSVPGAGTYHITVSKGGYITSEQDSPFSCGGTLIVWLDTLSTVLITVRGCCGNRLPGATVVIGGTTYITDSIGNVHVGGLTIGSYPWTADYPNFPQGGGTVNVTSDCSRQNVSTDLDQGAGIPDPGYGCYLRAGTTASYPWAIHDSVAFTDSVYGAVTLTATGGGGGWAGTKSVSYPGLCGCPARTVTFTYTITGGACGTGFSLTVSCPTLGNRCPDPAGLAIGTTPAIPLTIVADNPMQASGTYASTCGVGSSDFLYGNQTPIFTLTEL